MDDGVGRTVCPWRDKRTDDECDKSSWRKCGTLGEETKACWHKTERALFFCSFFFTKSAITKA